MKKCKKITAVFLAVIMLLSVMPIAGIDFFKASALEASGQLSDTVYYTFDEATGTLTISGTGDMPDYSWEESPFSEDDSIKNVIIENGITSVGSYAFADCFNLTSVNVSDSVTSINKCAFLFCEGLTVVTLGKNVINIGGSAFCYCYSLTSITIPDNVTNIGVGAFQDCSNLRKITIPDSVTIIGDGAFENTSIGSLSIPDSVISIGEYAFFGTYCNDIYYAGTPSQFSSVAPKGLLVRSDCYCEALYANIYYYCNGRYGENIFLKDDEETHIPHIYGTGEMYDFPVIKYYTDCYGREFCYRSISPFIGLSSVVIDDGVTSIGANAFWGNYNQDGCLSSITIPDSVTSIGDGAFAGCRNLKGIEIPDSVTSIGTGAFYGCDTLISITIPDSVTSINPETFDCCTGLTSITIPASVTSIGYMAFGECESLTDVYYAGTEEQWNEIEIGFSNGNLLNANIHFAKPDAGRAYLTDTVYYTFDEATGTVTIGGTGNIPGNAFRGDLSIENVVIEDGITGIDDEAFWGLGIESVTIPDSITSIGSGAFEYCHLKSVTIPDSITSIGDYVFCGCDSLTDVTIPDSVTSIGNYAFTNCSNLGDITIPDTVTSIGNSAFASCYSFENIEIPDSVTSIGEFAFSGCGGITDIIIPDSVTSIGEGAFNDCDNLDSVTIPDSVTSLEDYVFYGCDNLKDITIPDSVTSIGDNAFAYCFALTDITIPDGVTSINRGTFNYCTGLTSVTIPDSVTSIDDSAFANCSGLTDIYYSGSSEQWNALGISAGEDATVHYYWGCEHNYAFADYITAPDCTHDGTANFVCTICGDTKVEVVPAQHSFKHMTMPATCTQPGSEYDICTACFIMQNYNVIPAKGHTWSEWVIDTPATCTEDGSRHRFCTECAEGYETETIPATGHNYEHMVVDATCEKAGNEYDICKACMDIKNITVLPALGHKWSEWKTEPEATCTEDGIKYRICETCEKREEIILDAPGHSYVDTVTAPTCEEQGYTTHTCSICGDVVEDTYVPATGHKYEWVVTVNPTTTSTGIMENKCEYCGNVINTMTIPRLIADTVEGITLSAEKEAVALGGTVTLTATVLPETATNKNVIWKSSDTSVATVSDGTVTAVKPGVTVITAQAEGTGYKEYCLVRVVGLRAVNVNTVIDGVNGLVYGFELDSTDITNYIEVVDDSMSLECGDTVICTGSQINIVCDGEIVDTYEAVLFGDVNHDGWYDGSDSVIVNCLVNGILSREQVGEAVYAAADCNHDDVIDENDVALLEQAGLILANVDQSKNPAELFEDEAFCEYINLIDQSPITAEKAAEEAPADTTPVNEPVATKNLLQQIIDFIIYIFKLITSYISKVF